MRLHRLSAVKIKSITRAGRHADGGGLYLVVDGERRRWVYLYMRNGRRREMGLGAIPAVSLIEARRKAHDAREAVARGQDPIALARASRRSVTLKEAAEAVIADKAAGWRGAVTKAGWERSLYVHASKLAATPVDAIDTEAVLSVVRPLWTAKPESGAKLRERLEVVLDAATVKGWRFGENPARWKGHLQHILSPRQKLSRGHHRALPYRDAPAAFARLADVRSMGARVLEFVILTAVREGMARAATWGDLQGDLWVVPREKTKTLIEMRIPLSAPAQAVIAAVRTPVTRKAADLVFPGGRRGAMLTNPALLKALGRIGIAKVATVHGWRSTFRDWAGEETDHARDVIEMALGHIVGSEAERAYRRGDALEKRRRLMDDWARYLLPSGSVQQNPEGPPPQSRSGRRAGKT